MSGLIILGLFLILWGAAVICIALIKPAKIWKLGKIQGFVKLMGDKGVAIFFLIIGIIALGGGILLILP